MKSFEERFTDVSAFALSLLKNCENVVVGVSGGSDSIALLHFLITLKVKDNLDVKILAAHVNHMLRGKESERDEAFVINFCEKKNIVLKVLRVDVSKKAKELRKGLEETSRIVRYKFFKDLLESSCGGIIAVAHTLTDSIETALFNFSRGTGIEGLRGIKRRNGKIFRPFIDLTKSDTVNYCKVNKLEFVHDSSNDHLMYKRNIIRHKILPALREVNESFESNFSRAFELLVYDSEYLNAKAEKKVKKCKISENKYYLGEILKDHFSILSRVIRIIIKNSCSDMGEKGIGLSYKSIRLIMKFINKGSGVVELNKFVKIKILGSVLEILRTKQSKIVSLPKIKSRFIKDILTEKTGDFIIRVIDSPELALINEGPSVSDFYKCLLDYDSLPSGSVLRCRCHGDRFNQAGRGVTKTLKKLFNESEIDVSLRGKLGLIAFGSNVLWLEGFGASDSCKVVSGRTKRALFIKRRQG